MTAQQINANAESTDFTDFLREDYENMADEIEVEFQTLSKEQALRIQVDNELDSALKELESLKEQLPKEQMHSLFDQVSKNAIDAVVGHFGLAAVVLNSKEGGNVNTTHNVRQGIYASEAERQRYENRGEYDSYKYHSDKNYKKTNETQGKLKEQGQLTDYMTGEKIAPNAKTNLDHKVAAKTIHDDPARVLAEVDGAELANTKDNLSMTYETLNNAKRARNSDEFLEFKKKNLAELEKRAQQRELTDNEKLRKEKLEAMNDEDFKKAYDESKEKIDKKIDKAYYTSAKPYKEAVITGAQDAGKMAIYSAIGVILKEFIEGMSIELKILFKEFGNESLKDIFKRFAERLKKIWANLREKWKDIIAGSFEAGIVAFFSNLVVFAINIVFTTIKKVVQIIRAGFNSLYQAVKKLFDKNTPKDERMFEASKIFVAGLISAVTMLSAEAIRNFLKTIPGLNVILEIPIPLTDENIGTALSICISAALGAVLSTIAIYYMDKWASGDKESNLQIQIMTKSGEVVQYKLIQSWFVLKDAQEAVYNGARDTMNAIDDLGATLESLKRKRS